MDKCSMRAQARDLYGLLEQVRDLGPHSEAQKIEQQLKKFVMNPENHEQLADIGKELEWLVDNG